MKHTQTYHGIVADVLLLEDLLVVVLGRGHARDLVEHHLVVRRAAAETNQLSDAYSIKNGTSESECTCTPMEMSKAYALIRYT